LFTTLLPRNGFTWAQEADTEVGFTANGAFPGQTEFTANGDLPLNNTQVDDLIMLVGLSVDSTTNYITDITGGGVDWTQVGEKPFHGVVNGCVATTWIGKVTAEGQQTASVQVTGGAPTIAIANQEFLSSVGDWTFEDVQYFDQANGNSWPGFEQNNSTGVAFGFGIDSGIAVAGETAGWHYEVTSHNDPCAWSVNPYSSSAAVWSDSGQIFGAVILVKEKTQSGLLMASMII
jgi:hypothetical protein